MSDQGKWAKIWVSTLANPKLENLELHEWARWVRLILFMKAHGTNGKLVFDPPFRALQTVMRADSWDTLLEFVRHCPGFTLFEPLQSPLHQPSQHKDDRWMIVCKNWYKYQGDFSRERVSKWRKKQTVTPTVTSLSQSNGLRREEKRRITSTSTSPTSQTAADAASAPLENGRPAMKDYEEAKEGDFCGPPKGWAKQIKKL